MEKFTTEQEKFWAGSFGDKYTDRNQGRKILAGNLALFSKILSRTTNVKSVIEFGANLGMNLQAIKLLVPEADLSAIEINKKAVECLKASENMKVYAQSILDFQCDYGRDLVLIKGVLIHINPDMLPQVYDLMYKSSKRYICVAEYYNPTPVGLKYRGHENKLFKRDFAGELLDKFSDLRLVDYGFSYHRDNNFEQDDITWFLLEKKKD